MDTKTSTSAESVTGKDELNNTVFLRRMFRNKDGDWTKLEAKCKEIQTYAQVVQELADDFVKAETKLKLLMLEAYQLAPVVDCLYYDSPVCPDRMTTHIKAYLKKQKWSGIRDVWIDHDKIRPFADHVREACKWLLKFSK